MYSLNNKTEAISVRMMAGLKERVDFECAQYPGWNRNKFINYAVEMALEMRHEVRCGNVREEELPPALRRFCHLMGL